MHWKPGDGIARHEMHPARRLHLSHGIVPLRPDLIHFLSSGIVHDILCVRVSGYEPDDLAGAGNYGCVQVDVTAIGQDEFIERDGELMRRSEVGIQCVERSRAAWDGVNSQDPASCCAAYGNDETAKDINGLHDTPGDRLTDLPDTHFLVESNLQRGAVGNGRCNDMEFGRRFWRGGLRLG